MILRLPVHPISKKIIVTEYGCEPVQLKKNDLLLQQLLYHDRNPNFEYLSSLLTDHIHIEVGINHGKHIQKHQCAGFHIYKYHVDHLMQFMFSQVLAGLPAWSAMIQWMELYGVEDHELSTDAAYRKWQRWSSKHPVICAMKRKSGRRGVKFAPNGTQSDQQQGRLIKVSIPTPEPKLQIGAEKFLRRVQRHLFTKGGKLNQTVMQKLVIALYVEVGAHPKEDVADRFGITLRSVNRNLAGFRDIYDTEPAVRQHFEALLS